jgi:mannose/fructose/N-acetylgalactosamine-specific phosphotransferase system component IID
MTRFLRIIEIMWLVVAAIALGTAIYRASNGQSWGNYLWITVFTAAVAAFMYWFKKRNRRYMEAYHQEQARQAAEERQQS